MARAETSERTVLLMADDDPADCLLTEKALRRADITCPLYVVHDGAELLDYLKRRGNYAEPEAAPRPSLILLDLNMPKINGTEVLEQLRDEPELRRIPWWCSRPPTRSGTSRRATRSAPTPTWSSPRPLTRWSLWPRS